MPSGGVPLLFGVVLSVFAATSHGAPGKPLSRGQRIDSVTMAGAVDFLLKFGYLRQPNLEKGILRTEEQLRDAIAKMQRYAGVEPTGRLDRQTVAIMQWKRCGVPDLLAMSERVKRYALQGSKWPKTHLTWKIRDGTDQRNHNEIRQELTLAFQMWSNASQVTFTELGGNSEPDISISFFRGFHGDGYSFDGPGKILAHAFFPGPGLGGDIHFDEEESWQINNRNNDSGVSLFAVTAHAIGHTLGLSHSSETSSIMYPYYKWLRRGDSLPADDRMGVEQLYGAKRREWATLPDIFIRSPYTPRPPWQPPRIPYPGVTQRPTPPSSTRRPPKPEKPLQEIPVEGKPQTCDTAYDAISIIRREIFIFKDKYFWRLDDRGLRKNYPVPIHRFWYNLPKDLTRIDAVYERPKDRKIVFFIGTKYWVFEANNPLPGYPKSITQLGLPPGLKRLDAAMVWGHNGKTYFFSGEKYWRFDEADGRVEWDYPRDMAVWLGVPYHIDSAFQAFDGRTYFFKGKGFWKFNDNRMMVENEDPVPIAPYWMACADYSTTSNSQHSEDNEDEAIAPSVSVNCESCKMVETLTSYFIEFIFLIL